MRYYDDIGCQFDEDWDNGSRYFARKPRSKEVVWRTGRGEIFKLTEMEDSHVQNTINYLNRKKFEWERAQQTGIEHGVELGSMIINDKTVETWLGLFFNEVKRRQKA